MQIINHRLCHDDGTPFPFVATNRNFGGVLKPSYLLMHYTAGTNAKAAIQVLSDPRVDNPSRAVSAHLVIGRDGSITQLVPFDRVAWHAGWSYWEGLDRMNFHTIGIEMDNEGYVKKLNGKWLFRGLPTQYSDDDVLEETHWKHFRPYGWVKYSPEQYNAALEVAKALKNAYDLKDVIGHEDVHIAKVDPGPAFPMPKFRHEIFGRTEPLIETFTTRRDAAVYRNIDDKPPHLLPRLLTNPLPPGTKVDIVRSITEQKKTVIVLPPKKMAKKGEKKKGTKIIEKQKMAWNLVKVISDVKGSINFTGWVPQESVSNNSISKTVEIFKDIGTRPGFGHPLHPATPLPERHELRLLTVQGRWALIATTRPTPRFRFFQGWVSLEDIQPATD